MAGEGEEVPAVVQELVGRGLEAERALRQVAEDVDRLAAGRSDLIAARVEQVEDHLQLGVFSHKSSRPDQAKTSNQAWSRPDTANSDRSSAG